MGEIKQTNFRIDQETADLFRRFCEEQGLNQAQGFDHIMQIVEMDRAKAAAPERLTEIEGFEKSVKDIMAAYLNSIEINKNAEERIREQFASALERKDKTIDDLQAKIDQLSADKNAADQAKAAAEKAQATAEEREKNATEQMDAAKKTAADQERINAMLTGQLADATDKLSGYDDLKKSEANLKAKIEQMQHELETVTVTLSHTKELYEVRLADAQTTADKLAAVQESEADLKARVADLERSLTEQTKAAEKDAQQAKTEAELTTERAVMTKEREMQSQLRQADKENAKLTAQIEQLQARIAILEGKTE